MRKLALVWFVLLAVTVGLAQTQVTVPGNASGDFGNHTDLVVPLVPAITVTGPGAITVTYVSGTVYLTGGGGLPTGPTGITSDTGQGQLPLQEAQGIAGGVVNNFGALMGVFVPQSRVGCKGFSAIDGTKHAVHIGVRPVDLFFVGESKTINVTEAGTLFLGINDEGVVDNSGSFVLTVSGP